MTFSFVLKMAGYMEQKLSENRYKGDALGWRCCSLNTLLRRLKEETREIEDAIDSGCSADTVWREAADVANFAMMLADVYEQPTAKGPGNERTLGS